MAGRTSSREQGDLQRQPPPGVGDQAVYTALKEHQVGTAWEYRDVVERLHVFADIFNGQFKLGLPEVALIGIERLHTNCLGQFCFTNGFGLRLEILIADEHVRAASGDRGWIDVLATLLHEQLHAFQHLHGRPGRPPYHNRDFVRRAAELGLIVDKYGGQQLDSGATPFLSVLRRHGVSVPPLDEPVLFTPAETSGSQHPKSKLGLWVCGCRPPVRLRVGRTRLNVVCQDCGLKFEKVGH